jgi:hypothetical protein
MFFSVFKNKKDLQLQMNTLGFVIFDTAKIDSKLPFHLVHKMLSIFETRNRNFLRHEGDLGGSTSKVQRSKTLFEQSWGQKVQEVVDGEPGVEAFVSPTHDLDKRRFKFEAGCLQSCFQLSNDCVCLEIKVRV